MGTLWNIFTSAELQQQARGRVAPMLLVLLQDAAQGLQALHSHHICHGDLVGSAGSSAAWLRATREQSKCVRLPSGCCVRV